MVQATINNMVFVFHDCPDCHVAFAITESHDDRLRDCGNMFYCPNGHPMNYKASTSDKLRKASAECERLRQLAQERDAVATENLNKLLKAQRQIKRLKAGTRGDSHTQTQSR